MGSSYTHTCRCLASSVRCGPMVGTQNLGKDVWLRIAADVAQRETPKSIARKYKVQLRAILYGLDRLKRTGSILPQPRGQRKGKKVPVKRRTTAEQDEEIVKFVRKERGKELELTTRMIKKGVGLPVSRTTIGRRLKERGYAARPPRNKTSYTPQQRKVRVAFAKYYKSWSVEDWAGVFFTDEHDVKHPGGKYGSRQVQSRKRFIWRMKEEALRNDCVRPKGKSAKGGQHTKVCVAVGNGKVILIETAKKYIDNKKPQKPRPPQKVSLRGKVIGRPRQTDTAKKKSKGGLDGRAYAVYLEDLAPLARAALGTPAAEPLLGLQDNYSVHYEEHAEDSAAAVNMEFIEGFPPLSPDLNPIEAIFGIADERLVARHANARAKDKGETLQRFKGEMEKMSAEGVIGKTIATMPRRMKDVLKVNGGPTKW